MNEITQLFFKAGDLVKFVAPTFSGIDGARVGTRIARAVVKCEANGRPGFYYCYEEAAKRAHLVYWQDLVKL